MGEKKAFLLNCFSSLSNILPSVNVLFASFNYSDLEIFGHESFIKIQIDDTVLEGSWENNDNINCLEREILETTIFVSQVEEMVSGASFKIKLWN